MNIMTRMTDMARSEGDPKILETGPSSLGSPDRMAKALGWFAIGLGVSQLLAAPRYTRALGIEGNERLVRAFGAREIASGVLSLSVDKKAGLWSRVGGDVIDIAMLGLAMRDNPKRNNVATALAAVIGVTLLDVVAAQGVTSRHSRGRGRTRDYSDRSGFPQGVARARGAASDFATPPDYQVTPAPMAGRASPAAIADVPTTTH